jgi:hypothetical protein
VSGGNIIKDLHTMKHLPPANRPGNLHRAGSRSWIWLALAACLSPLVAQAARPLGTEDAGTNEARHCQLEAWGEHGKGSHETHLAPACGLGEGLELGAEWVRPQPANSAEHARYVGLKWAPEWLAWQDVRFGLKAMGGQARTPVGDDGGWHWQGQSWMAIASVPLNDKWTVHANLGQALHRGPPASAATYALGLVWTPHEAVVVFGELLGEQRSPACQTVGLRWWIIPDTLGLDLTHSRENATPGSRHTGIGLGWYGISF